MYLTFIDLTAAFDTVERREVWRSTEKVNYTFNSLVSGKNTATMSQCLVSWYLGPLCFVSVLHHPSYLPFVQDISSKDISSLASTSPYTRRSTGANLSISVVRTTK